MTDPASRLAELRAWAAVSHNGEDIQLRHAVQALLANYDTATAELDRAHNVIQTARAYCADCGPCNGGVTPDASYIGPAEDRSDRCWLCGDLRDALAAYDQHQKPTQEGAE